MKIIITERQRKLISEDEDREFLVKKKTAKKYLTKKFGDLTPITDYREGNIIFYIDKKRNVYFDYNEETDLSKFDYDNIWSVLENTMGFSFKQTQQVTKEWLEENYNLKVSLTYYVDYLGKKSWRRIKFLSNANTKNWWDNQE